MTSGSSKQAASVARVVGAHDVIRRQVGDQRCPRKCNRDVAGGAQSLVGGQPEVTHAGIVGEARHGIGRGVRGAVIDDHQFPVRQALSAQTRYRARQEGGLRVGRHHHRDRRAGQRHHAPGGPEVDPPPSVCVRDPGCHGDLPIARRPPTVVGATSASSLDAGGWCRTQRSGSRDVHRCQEPGPSPPSGRVHIFAPASPRLYGWLDAEQGSEIGQKLQEVINDAVSQWIDGFNRGDMAAVASLYAEDAKLMPPNQDMVSGREAISQFMTTFREQFGGREIALETLDVGSDGELGYEMGRYILGFQPEGGQPGGDVGKYLVVWKRQRGEWKIAYDMVSSSQPLDGERR